MARYKVPQDVEADDKLLGPFSFRQFVYLIIAVGLGFVAFLLFNIFPLLVIIPIPFIIFLGILALPLKKDQPMETYLSAVVDYYLKPQKRIWMPGQSDTSITITAPKVAEDNRTKDLSEEEAGRRLSFLANIVDTEGYAIKDTNANLRDDIASEASEAKDIFELNENYTLDHSLAQSTEDRRNQLLAQMRANINAQPAAPVNIAASSATIQPDMDEITAALEKPSTETKTPPVDTETPTPPPAPEPEIIQEPEPQPTPPQTQATTQEPEQKPEPTPPPTQEPEQKPDTDLENLANNPDFSIETIAKQAKRIQEKKAKDNEVYISLH